MTGPKPFDRGHARRGIGANVDDDHVRTAAFDSRPAVLYDPNRDAARTQKRRDLPFEFVIVADDGCRELCHGVY
jgi:hypothetical protein